MKKRLKYAKDLTIGDVIKITGYRFEVHDIIVSDDGVTVRLWCWARSTKTIHMTFSDPCFPVTVR